FTVLGVLGLLVFGWNSMQRPMPTHPLNIVAVQPAIEQKEKFDRTSYRKILDQLDRLSRPALQLWPLPQLMIWPESATPGPMLEDEQSYRFVTEFSATAHTDLLLGSDLFEKDEAYNAALLVPATGGDI